MVVASTSLTIPAALNLAYNSNVITTEDSLNSILILSRGTAIILLILYVMYLNFQLKSHSQLFEENPDLNTQEDGKEPETAEQATLSPPIAIAVLFAVSLLIATCAEHLVGTIDDVVQALQINRTFIGLIVLPIVGNAAEYVSAIRAAAKGKMSLAIGVSIGSSMQIALFVTPALVILGWTIQQPMSLAFEPFGAVIFFLSVIVVMGLISDGESNYLEGAMLVGTYVALIY
jgi:Ca2+:H+ antiporter